MSRFKDKVASQVIHDSIPQSNCEAQIKIKGAEEMVAMFIRNNPRSMGKNFLIDLLNSYIQRMKMEHEQG